MSCIELADCVKRANGSIINKIIYFPLLTRTEFLHGGDNNHSQIRIMRDFLCILTPVNHSRNHEALPLILQVANRLAIFPF